MSYLKILRPDTRPVKDHAEWDKESCFTTHPLFDCYVAAGAVVHKQPDELQSVIRELERDMDTFLDLDRDAMDDALWSAFPAPGCIVSAFYELGPIVLPTMSAPEIADLFWEVRVAYACDAYFAALCCARGCLEHAVTDVGTRIKAFPPNDGTVEYFKNYSIRKRINALALSMQDVGKSIHDAYTNLSMVIHSGSHNGGALELLREIRESITALYTMYQKRIEREDIGEID